MQCPHAGLVDPRSRVQQINAFMHSGAGRGIERGEGSRRVCICRVQGMSIDTRGTLAPELLLCHQHTALQQKHAWG